MKGLFCSCCDWLYCRVMRAEAAASLKGYGTDLRDDSLNACILEKMRAGGFVSDASVLVEVVVRGHGRRRRGSQIIGQAYATKTRSANQTWAVTRRPNGKNRMRKCATKISIQSRFTCFVNEEQLVTYSCSPRYRRCSCTRKGPSSPRSPPK